jgi:hypothetical protein
LDVLNGDTARLRQHQRLVEPIMRSDVRFVPKADSCAAAILSLLEHLVDESGSILIDIKERMEAGVGECWSGCWSPLALSNC